MNARMLQVPALIGVAAALFAVTTPLHAAQACHDDPHFASKLVNGEPINCVMQGDRDSDKQGLAGRKAESIRTAAKQTNGSDGLTIRTP
ncbi:MAG: hypothetical protein HYU77_11465 [Betaproteobacteria bacterium]|nr:hypothetical protein [Betaproteobacteria bacterium]